MCLSGRGKHTLRRLQTPSLRRPTSFVSHDQNHDFKRTISSRGATSIAGCVDVPVPVPADVSLVLEAIFQTYPRKQKQMQIRSSATGAEGIPQSCTPSPTATDFTSSPALGYPRIPPVPLGATLGAPFRGYSTWVVQHLSAGADGKIPLST